MEFARKDGLFVSTTYRIHQNQEMVPDIPTQGPCCDEHACQLGIKDRRERKTGPSHPLFVMCCKTHGAHFTLYPPGFTPFGRTPLVKLAPDGGPLSSDRGPPFEDSFFQAIIDGKNGNAWLRESLEDSQMPRFETQRRHLAQHCQLFRLLALPSKERERVAETLKLPGLVLHQAAQVKGQANGYHAIASCLYPILENLSETRQTFQGLSACGYYAGLWPKNQFWDSKRCRWHDSPFPEGFSCEVGAH